MYLLGLVFLMLMGGAIISPFPYWPTYWKLWGSIIKSNDDLRVKRKQAWFLLKALFMAPIKGVLWAVDEIFFSAYRRVEVRPVFIIGEPRCGTTLLHRTLAKDAKNFFAIRHIEWRYPFLIVQRIFQFTGADKWLCRISYWPKNEVGKKAEKMHPNRLNDWEEDGIFFEENYLHHFFIFLRFPSPEMLNYVDSFSDLPEKDRKKMLAVYKKTLQKMAYLHGGGDLYYLSKEVTSHDKIPFLVKEFPSARFILTVRRSSDFMSSLLALIRVSTQAKTDVDPILIPKWKECVIDRMVNDCQRLLFICSNVIPQDSIIKVSAKEYMKNIDSCTEYIYQRLGLVMSEGFRKYLVDLRKGQKVRKKGYSYSKEQFPGFSEYDRFVELIDEQFSKSK